MSVWLKFLLLAVGSLLLVLFAPFAGMTWISPRSIVQGGVDREIFLALRLPRVLLAFFAGAGLALGGTAFQALFRNSLATPYTLGVSSGASLGAALYMVAGLPAALLGFPGASVAAFLGALAAIGLVYGIAMGRRGTSTGTLLLAGVAASLFFSSLLLALQAASGVVEAYRVFHWLIGSLESAEAGQVIRLAPFIASGGLLLLYRSRDLDLMLTGEALARSRGVDTGRLRVELFFGVSILVGAVVSFCGPIGFIGLMVPHSVRLLLGPTHRLLVPGSMLAGGAFLAACDAVARSLLAPAEIPVGVVTALLGGPFFLWLLLSRERVS